MAKLQAGLLSAGITGAIGGGAYTADWKGITRVISITPASNPQTVLQQDNRFDFRDCVHFFQSYPKRWRDKFVGARVRYDSAWLWLIHQNFKYFHNYPHKEHIKISHGSGDRPSAFTVLKYGGLEPYVKIICNDNESPMRASLYFNFMVWYQTTNRVEFLVPAYPVGYDQDYGRECTAAEADGDILVLAFHCWQNIKHQVTAESETVGRWAEWAPL